MNKNAARGWLLFFALLFFAISIFFGYKGYDKMTNYYNPDSHYGSVNAYVGGDAYNYIINGNYATGFYVLSAGSLICSVICFATGPVIAAISDKYNGQ